MELLNSAKLRKTKSFAGLAFLYGCLSSCAHVPDVPGCVELDPQRGYCVHTISATEFYIDEEHPFEGKTWPEVRAESVIAPASSWAAIKSYILRQCARREDCDIEEEEPVPGEDAIRKLESKRR